MHPHDYKVFTDAADSIETYGWNKHSLYGEKNERCLIGALQDACRINGINLDTRTYCDLYNQVSDKIHELSRIAKMYPDIEPEGWNDVVWRRKRAVIKVLRSLAADSVDLYVQELEHRLAALQVQLRDAEQRAERAEREARSLRRRLFFKELDVDTVNTAHLRKQIDEISAELASVR